MKIKFLGSGSAFVTSKENYNSNILIEDEESNLLFDCGYTINESLEYNNKNIEDIQNIFISHLHSDHIGGLEYLAFKRYFSQFPNGIEKPTLHITKTLSNRLWNNSLKGSMEYLFENKKEPETLKSYFNLNILNPYLNNKFKIGNCIIKIISVEHVKYDKNKKTESYGIMIYYDNKKIFITGDTIFNKEHMLKYYEESDVIFHDCELENYKGGVHSQYHELTTLPEKIKNKMYLYHYANKNGLPDCKNNGFVGFVKRGDIFYF